MTVFNEDFPPGSGHRPALPPPLPSGTTRASAAAAPKPARWANLMKWQRDRLIAYVEGRASALETYAALDGVNASGIQAELEAHARMLLDAATAGLRERLEEDARRAASAKPPRCKHCGDRKPHAVDSCRERCKHGTIIDDTTGGPGCGECVKESVAEMERARVPSASDGPRWKHDVAGDVWLGQLDASRDGWFHAPSGSIRVVHESSHCVPFPVDDLRRIGTPSNFLTRALSLLDAHLATPAPPPTPQPVHPRRDDLGRFLGTYGFDLSLVDVYADGENVFAAGKPGASHSGRLLTFKRAAIASDPLYYPPALVSLLRSHNLLAGQP